MKMAATVVVTLLVLLISVVPSIDTYPTGCAAKANNHDRVVPTQCTFGTVSNPITYGSFSAGEVQRLELIGVSGTLSSPSFTGFTSYTSTTASTGYAASLLIKCASSSTLTLVAGTFTNMAYLETLAFQDCDLAALPADVFAALVSLDHLSFTAGSLTSFDIDSFTGLSITNFPIPGSVGGLTITNSALTGGTLTEGMFSGLTEMKSLVLKNMGITSVTSTLFASMVGLQKLSLAENNLTTLPSGMIDTLKAVSYVDLAGNQWDCSCDNLWFLPEFYEKHVRSEEIALCTTPTLYANTRASQYYSAECETVDVCAGETGIVLGGSCLNIIVLVCYIVGFITLVVAIITVILICKTRTDLVRVKRRMENKKGRSWNRVQQAMKKAKGIMGQKPPASTNLWM